MGKCLKWWGMGGNSEELLVMMGNSLKWVGMVGNQWEWWGMLGNGWEPWEILRVSQQIYLITLWLNVKQIVLFKIWDFCYNNRNISQEIRFLWEHFCCCWKIIFIIPIMVNYQSLSFHITKRLLKFKFFTYTNSCWCFIKIHIFLINYIAPV